MTSPLDPPDGNWWDRAVNRRETIWLGIAGVWSLGIFAWMSGFTRFGDQNPVGETYDVEPEAYAATVETYEENAGTTSAAAVEESRAPTEEERQDVLVPPTRSVYVFPRRFSWGGLPVVLEAGKEYDIHLSAADVQHGFSVRPEESLSQQINLQVFPGTEWVVPMSFDEPGTYQVICNEFCGQGHASMHDTFYVADPAEYDTVTGE
ncbi:cytochrome C oxidase subunit II [Halovenus salina]|uniref:cytochrome C oxidase subunit II n=1 Tax=Halovenus salina TaxID=1510225 RepID=UPI002260EE02|nr:cytochrome C oxidase subunit II [Halovenus salina]